MRGKFGCSCNTAGQNNCANSKPQDAHDNSPRQAIMNAMSTVSTVPSEAGVLERIQKLESEYLLQNYARYPLVL